MVVPASPTAKARVAFEKATAFRFCVVQLLPRRTRRCHCAPPFVLLRIVPPMPTASAVVVSPYFTSRRWVPAGTPPSCAVQVSPPSAVDRTVPLAPDAQPTRADPIDTPLRFSRVTLAALRVQLAPPSTDLMIMPPSPTATASVGLKTETARRVVPPAFDVPAVQVVPL